MKRVENFIQDGIAISCAILSAKNVDRIQLTCPLTTILVNFFFVPHRELTPPVVFSRSLINPHPYNQQRQHPQLRCEVDGSHHNTGFAETR
mmetsp:Transcript_139/g.210  ORF Transcript_139/g.210 Transcript_139/m.210 type:complete len:91 (+) Transcript_139:69-341(+)